jgi:hypothetical protein
MTRSTVSFKRFEQLSRLTDKELVEELKVKGLDSFGTRGERLERLRKHLGIPSQTELDDPFKPKTEVKSSCVKEIEKMKKKREERRVKDNLKRQELKEMKANQEAQGRYGNIF